MRQKDLDKYAALMGEAARRLEVIRDFQTGASKTTYVRTNTESECLQLRKVLEVVAFSSLVSNRRAYAQVRATIARDWHALRILRQIEQLNPAFYPQPVLAVAPSGFAKARAGFLTYVQFKKLFATCGGLLHSTNPFRPSRDFAVFERRIPKYVDRIEALLADHLVHLVDSRGILRVRVSFHGEHRVVVQHLVPVKRPSASPT